MQTINVVIPTYNRPEKLRAGLAALEKQSDRDFRVIIVDDGSTQKNAETYRKIVSESKCSCTIIHQQNKGIAGATNAGLQKVESGLIILTDDDILPPADFIRKHRGHHLVHPGTIITGRAEFDLELAQTDVQRYKNYMDEEWLRILFGSELKLHKLSLSNFTVTAANMSFEKKMIERIGPFREDLRDCQDFEFGLRAFKAGIDLFYDTELVVIHNDPITLKYYAGRQRSYTENRRKVLEAYPEFSKNMRAEVALNPNGLKRLVYRFLSSGFITHFIESSVLMKLVPRKFRYRIYGVTIAALSAKRS